MGSIRRQGPHPKPKNQSSPGFDWFTTVRQLDAIGLIMLVLCGCFARHPPSKASEEISGSEEVLVSIHSVPDVGPIELSEQDFHGTLRELAQDFQPATHPREAAFQLFEDSFENLRGEVTIGEVRIVKGPRQRSENLHSPQQLISDYLHWCARHQGPGDCLDLLNDESSPNLILGIEKYVLALAISMQGVLAEAAQTLQSELREAINPRAIMDSLLWTLATYMALWIIPEPVSKGIAAAVTLAMMAYLGVKTLWNLMDAWRQLTESLDNSDTFGSLHTSGTRFGKVLGQNAARILIMVVTAVVGGTASKVISKFGKMRGFSRASNSAETQGSVPPGAAAEVQVVAVSQKGTFKITRSSGAKAAKSISTNYRETFFAAYPHLRGKVWVHHAVEQQVLKKYPGLFTEAELHSLKNLRGVPKSVNAEVHLGKIRREWNEFYRSNRKPTRQDVLDFATQIDKKFGALFDPPL